jgi:hypothetical protein
MIVLLPKQWKKVVLLETLQPICSKSRWISREKEFWLFRIWQKPKEELNMLVGQKFGAASLKVVIEEF